MGTLSPPAGLKITKTDAKVLRPISGAGEGKHEPSDLDPHPSGGPGACEAIAKETGRVSDGAQAGIREGLKKTG